MKVVYPGSFDPPTVGHWSIVRRAAKMFDAVEVCILKNPAKSPRADATTRKALWEQLIGSLPNVRVTVFDGMLLDEVRRAKADAILRGLRSQADFMQERPVADAFWTLYGVETVFLACAPEMTFVSSSMVREILAGGGDIAGLVPDEIADGILLNYRTQ